MYNWFWALAAGAASTAAIVFLILLLPGAEARAGSRGALTGSDKQQRLTVCEVMLLPAQTGMKWSSSEAHPELGWGSRRWLPWPCPCSPRM